MRNSFFIPPTSISFVTTDKCTAACNNCCFGCNPKNNNRLSYNEIKHYIDQALSQFRTIKLLVLTGGECFTLNQDLDRIIQYGNEKEMTIRVVTNAYWAKSFKIAYLRLADLKEKGLRELNISTGDEHQEWIKLDNIIYTTVAAILLNITIAINIETSPITLFNASYIHNDIRLKKYKLNKNSKFHILNGKWVYFKKEKNENLKIDKLNNNCSAKKNTRCTSLFKDLVIFPNHYMYACCGLTCIYTPYLYLGNLKKHSLSFLYNRQFDDFIKLWLFTEGPSKILDFIRSKQNNKDLSDNSEWHICQTCAEIFKNKENIKCIQKNYKEVMSNIAIKFSLLKRKIFSINHFKE